MFSIIIPTYNNIEYLKILLSSLKKNSKFNHEIIIHINEGSDGTLDFVKQNNLKHTHTKKNIGLCSATNLAATKATTEYIIFAHDDMYFCPGWDVEFNNEIKQLNTKAFYISGTMIERNTGHIQFDCGDNSANFDEFKLLKNLKQIKYFNHQGSTWAPHLIHRDYWNKVGGLSEEFNPGIGSDPDLNIKLWNVGVRIFKGLGNCKVYHFGSTVLRKKKFKRNSGGKTFLLKWGISIKFFTKHYLRGGKFSSQGIISNKYDGPLQVPTKSFIYFLDLLICKINYIYLKIIKF